MKHLISFLFAFVLLLSLTACSSEHLSSTSNDTAQAQGSSSLFTDDSMVSSSIQEKQFLGCGNNGKHFLERVILCQIHSACPSPGYSFPSPAPGEFPGSESPGRTVRRERLCACGSTAGEKSGLFCPPGRDIPCSL